MAADNTYESTQVSVAELTKWAKKMQIVFPKNTRPLGIRQITGLDDVVFLKVEFDKREWLPFLKSVPIHNEEFSDSKRFFLGTDQGFWDPNQCPELPTAQALLSGGKVLNLGVDQSKAAIVTVYLMWHST